MHYTLQFSLDCITGVSESERKKWRRGHGVSTCYLHYRRKLKFHYMLTPVSFNPLLPFVLTFGSHPVQISTEKCLFQRNNSVTIPGPNETVDRLDQVPACSLPGHHILISSVMLYLTPQTRCTITTESSELLGGSL